MDDERLKHRTDRLYGLGRCRGLLSPVCGLSLFFANVTFGLTASDDHSTDVAALLGANRFYEQGIFGQGATAAIVEGGLVWNGDSSTQHVTHYYAHPDTWRHDLGDTRDLWDRHATWSGSLLGGRGPLQSAPEWLPWSICDPVQRRPVGWGPHTPAVGGKRRPRWTRPIAISRRQNRSM